MRPHLVMRETELAVKRGFYTFVSKADGQVKVAIGKPEHTTQARMVSNHVEKTTHKPRKGAEKASGKHAEVAQKLPAEVVVVGMDTLDAAHAEHRIHSHQEGASRERGGNQSSQIPLDYQPRVMVLDFASDSVPGGGARGNQLGTQEESLCRRSSLLLGLESLTYPIPYSGCAVCNQVVVFRHGEHREYSFFDPRENEHPFTVVVVASAMPSMEGAGDAEEEAVRAAKIDVILKQFVQAASQSKVRSLVLGAWGCGAFGNDARNVATVFRRRIEHWFSADRSSFGAEEGDICARGVDQRLRIVFAVHGRKNLTAFQETFQSG